MDGKIPRLLTESKEGLVVKKNLFALFSLALIVSLAFVGCQKPDAELKRAEQAISDARADGAAEYAAGDLASAEQLLAEGKELMKKFCYKKAKEKFEEAYRLAMIAKGKKPAGYCPSEGSSGGGTTITKNQSGKPTSHTVVKGECLWRIAEYDQIYDDPFQWPLIYSENRENIDRTANRHGFHQNEENWIFPGQEFSIPRDATTDEIKAARRRAGAPAVQN